MDTQRSPSMKCEMHGFRCPISCLNKQTQKQQRRQRRSLTKNLHTVCAGKARSQATDGRPRVLMFDKENFIGYWASCDVRQFFTCIISLKKALWKERIKILVLGWSFLSVSVLTFFVTHGFVCIFGKVDTVISDLFNRLFAWFHCESSAFVLLCDATLDVDCHKKYVLIPKHRFQMTKQIQCRQMHQGYKTYQHGLVKLCIATTAKLKSLAHYIHFLRSHLTGYRLVR